MPHYYKLLGLPPDAPQRQIKAKFRLLMLTTHPDIVGVNADLELFNRYTRAYKILGDPDRRRRYNAELGITVEPRPLKRGHDLYQRLSISLENAKTGASVPLTFLRYDPCSLCWCAGCQRCKNVGQIATQVEVQLDIPAGLKSGATVFVEGEGARSEPGGSRGDLIVYVYAVSKTKKNNT